MMNGSIGGREEPERFSFWRALAAQDIASVVAMVPVIVAMAIIYAKDPANRPFSVYDATLSYPFNASSTIPYWLAVVVPAACLLLSFAVGELAARRRLGASSTAAFASALHFSLDAMCVWIANALLTNVFKLLVGRYRPDWLARCQPAAPAPLQVAYGLPASANPACASGLPLSEIKDGHLSFPSGHASTAFAWGVYGAAYCLWAAFWRPARRYAAAGQARTWRERAAEDACSTLVFYWALWQPAWAWGVAVSRVIDNHHAPSDVVGGALLGATVGLCFVLRAIPRHYRFYPAPTQPAHKAAHSALLMGGDVTPPTPPEENVPPV